MKLALISLITTSVFANQPCNFEFEHIGTVKEKALDEISGIQASKQFEDTIWLHNDSGDKPRFFGMSLSGERKGEFHIEGAKHEDWEDLAIGNCPGAKSTCLYLGDIGDNPFKRDTLTIYAVKEPKPNSGSKIQKVPLYHQYTVKLDTKARNFESMVVDGKTLYLISKSDARAGKQYKEEGKSHIYKFTLSTKKKVTAKKIGTFDFFNQPEFIKGEDGKAQWQNYFAWSTAADYNTSTKKLALLTYGTLLEVDPTNWTNFSILSKTELPKQPQVEAVTYLGDRSWLMVSEYAHQPIYRASCK